MIKIKHIHIEKVLGLKVREHWHGEEAVAMIRCGLKAVIGEVPGVGWEVEILTERLVCFHTSKTTGSCLLVLLCGGLQNGQHRLNSAVHKALADWSSPLLRAPVRS